MDGTGEILLAEDDAAIREGLVASLEGEGYSVRACADGEQAVELFRARRPDLVLLDVMMPRKNGYRACQEIRARDAEVPILFLTAKDGDADELRGLSLGADDYVSKTASSTILLARLAAALARARRIRRTDSGDFAFAEGRVDVARSRWIAADGCGVDLTMREVEMLRCFAVHPDEVLTRDFLFTKFWGVDFVGDDTTLSMAIRRLRNKLGSAGSRLVAVYGSGYRYAAIEK